MNPPTPTLDSILSEIDTLPHSQLREYAFMLQDLNDQEQPDHRIPKQQMMEYQCRIFYRLHYEKVKEE